jgi:diguanylate cyclase (GGDEF)-like protein
MYTIMHNRIFGFLEGRSRAFLLAISYALVLFLGIIDYVTGDFSFIIFYLIPVFLGAWFVGKRSGVLLCVACGLSSFINKLLEQPDTSRLWFHTWNLLIEMAYLILLSLMFTTLRRTYDREKNLARIDPLTNALNRRSLFEVAEQEISRAHRYGRPFTVAYLDLDNFKNVNDRHGHHAGDAVLSTVVKTIQENVRRSDIVARVGGDEFVVILPETGAEQSRTALTKLQDKLLAVMESREWPVTFSIGTITYNAPPASVDEMLKKVDDLMYSVKASNKNGMQQEVVDLSPPC